ncbi:MAG TPA: hypothetical protein VKE25_13600, partial [Actinomycetes bacterium]|nr:hypothetical protein [Actinomycetes bacterium]
GARTFAGESRGWTSSRLSLASYKGKMVKIRFRMALDGFASVSSGYGWWLDNVRLYRCKAPALTGVSGGGTIQPASSPDHGMIHSTGAAAYRGARSYKARIG